MTLLSSLRTRKVKQSRKRLPGLLRRFTPRNDGRGVPIIIPAILAHSEREFRAGVRALGGKPRALHLDVGDGKFVAAKTWADPRVVGRLHIPNLEVHLMVQHPEREVEKWVKAGARRVIMHGEIVTPTLILPLLRRGRKIEFGIAINPETPVVRVRPFSKFIDFVLVMSVVPGAQGRPFDRRAIAKIKMLKRLRPRLVIAVDGGLNERTIPEVVRAGVDRLVVGSAIVKSKNPMGELRKLKRLGRASPSSILPLRGRGRKGGGYARHSSEKN